MTRISRQCLVSALVLCLGCLGVFASAGCGEVLSAADAGPSDGIDASIAPDGAPAPDAMPVDPCSGDVAQGDLGACYLSALCQLYNGCLELYPSNEACIAAGGPFGGGGDPLVGLTRILDAVGAGTTVYHADNAKSCIARLGAATCEQLFSDGDNIISDACRDMFSGTLVAGTICYEDEECQAQGAECQFTAACEMQCCIGACVDPLPVGDECTGASCVEGAYCVSNSVGAIRTCETGELNAPCWGSWECDGNFWCDQPSGLLGACKADFPSSATCTDDSQCPGAEKCIGDDLSPAIVGTCKTVLSAGDACDGRCDGPLWCDKPDASMAGTCTALPSLNGDCATSRRCAGLLWCDSTVGADSTCKARKVVSASCNDSSECAPPLFCDAAITNSVPGKCIAPQATGSLCDNRSHCQTSICESNGTVDVCQDYLSCF